jgi:uncharacterized SAM-binding protein YcdF (DUF218 family)
MARKFIFFPKRGLRLGGILLLLAVAAWFGGLFWFVSSIPHALQDDGGRTDAIVALTGGTERVETALSLLGERRAEKLFISGVYHGVEVSALLRILRSSEQLECCITLGYRADNTVGNANESAEWIRAQRFKTLRLVTASYHMPRSLLEFAAVMPAVRIVPHPVFPAHVKQEEWWRWRGTTALIVSEYVKFLVAWVQIELGLPRWSF